MNSGQLDQLCVIPTFSCVIQWILSIERIDQWREQGLCLLLTNLWICKTQSKQFCFCAFSWKFEAFLQKITIHIVLKFCSLLTATSSHHFGNGRFLRWEDLLHRRDSISNPNYWFLQKIKIASQQRDVRWIRNACTQYQLSENMASRTANPVSTFPSTSWPLLRCGIAHLRSKKLFSRFSCSIALLLLSILNSNASTLSN